MSVAHGSAEGPTTLDPFEERTRQKRIEEAMMADLGLARREQISTEEDRRKGKSREKAQVTRLSDQVGTKEYRLARLNKTGIDGWKTAYLDMDRDEEAEMLEDLGHGQSHRAALAESLKLSGHQEPGFSGRGGRARGGGRGGGVIGTRTRGGSSALNTNAEFSVSTVTPRVFGPQDARASSGSHAQGPHAGKTPPVTVRTAPGKSRFTRPQAIPPSRTSAAASRGVSTLGGHAARQPAATASSHVGQTARTQPPPTTQARSKVAARLAPRTASPPNRDYESRLTSGAEWLRARSIAFGEGANAITNTTPASTAQGSALPQSIHAPSTGSHPGPSATAEHIMLPSKTKQPEDGSPKVATSRAAALPTVVEPSVRQPSVKTRSIQGSGSSQLGLGPRSRTDFGVSKDLERLNPLSNPPSQARTISSRVSDVSGSQELLSAGHEDHRSQPASLRLRSESLFSSGNAPNVRLPSVDLTGSTPSGSMTPSYLNDLMGLDLSGPVKPMEISPAVDDQGSKRQIVAESSSDIQELQKPKELSTNLGQSAGAHGIKEGGVAATQSEHTEGAFDPSYWATFLPTFVNLTATSRRQALEKLHAEVQRELENEQEPSGELFKDTITPPGLNQTISAQSVPQQIAATQLVPEQTVVEHEMPRRTIQEQAAPEHTNSTKISETKESKETITRHDVLEAPVPYRDAITPMVPLTESIHAPRVPLNQAQVLSDINHHRPATWASQYVKNINANVIGDARNVTTRTNLASTTIPSPVNTGFPILAGIQSGTMQSRFAPQIRRSSVLSAPSASASNASHPTLHSDTPTGTRNATSLVGTLSRSIDAPSAPDPSPPAPNAELPLSLKSLVPTTLTTQPSAADLFSAPSLQAPAKTIAINSQTDQAVATTPYGAAATQPTMVAPALTTASLPMATTMPGQPNLSTNQENLPVRISNNQRPMITQSIPPVAMDQSSILDSERSGSASANALSPRSPNRPQPAFGGSSQESRFADPYTPPSLQLQNLHNAVQKSAAAKEEEAKKRLERGGGMAKSKWSGLH
ncbi:MAG: hypothetical protein M1836_004958 [Candelina mexicana]|nr:MAG: hypothetical protein M1836_004958 [Candelina mexicana]